MAVKEVNCHLSVKIKNFMTINPQISNLKRNPKMVTIKMVKNDQNFRFPTQSPNFVTKIRPKNGKINVK